jgi:uncharacterized protein (DUF934 family)
MSGKGLCVAMLAVVTLLAVAFPAATDGKTRQHNFLVSSGAFWRF